MPMLTSPQATERQMKRTARKHTQWVTVCAWCNQAEVDGMLVPVEKLSLEKDVELSHSICPPCRQKLMDDAVAKFSPKPH